MFFQFQQSVKLDPYGYSLKQINSETDYSKVLGFKEHFKDYHMYKSLKKGALHIAQKISLCPNLTQLDINLNNHQIEEEGAQAIAKSIQNCPKLQTLKLHMKWNLLGSELEVNELALSIQSRKKTLTNVLVDVGDNYLGDYYPKSLIQSVIQCENLQSLSLGFMKNFLDINISTSFKDIKNLRNLKNLYIDLSYNKLIMSGVQSLTFYISEIKTLESLDLIFKDNNIKQKCIAAIGQNISKLSQLRNLRLNCQENNIGSDGVQHFSTFLSLLNNLQSLILEFGWCNIDNKGCFSMISNISKCQSLKKLTLDLRWNQIGENNENQIDEDLKSSSEIENLTLLVSNNDLKSTGLQKLIQCISNLSQLNRLSLFSQQNNISSDFEELGQCISQYLLVPYLSLNLESNQITNEGLILLFKNISQSKSIQNMKVYLKCNPTFDKSCYEDFGKEIANFKHLNYFYISIEDIFNPNYVYESRQMYKEILKSNSLHVFEYQLNVNYFSKEYKQYITDLQKANRLIKYKIFN